MIQTQRITVGLLVSLMLLLAGCNASSDEDLSPNEFSQRYTPLQIDTVDKLVEIGAWEIMEKGEAISLIQHNLALNRLTIVSEQAKKVVLFVIEGEETSTQQVVDIPNLRVLGVDEEGEKLLVGRSGQRLNEQREAQEYFHWFAIWHVMSDSLDECISGTCIGELTDPDKIAYADIGAVMDAETVVAYDEDSYSSSILSPGNGGGIALVNSPDSDYWRHIGRIAVNSDQNRLAVVFQEGGVELYKITDPENWWPLAWFDVLEKRKENQLQPIQHAIFDSSAKWLAIVRGQELIIWQASGWERKVFQMPVGNVHGMRFNPSGELLFVGWGDSISVIALKKRRVVFDIQTPGITSLDISDDNRLLFWGDGNGVVHVLGVP